MTIEHHDEAWDEVRDPGATPKNKETFEALCRNVDSDLIRAALFFWTLNFTEQEFLNECRGAWDWTKSLNLRDAKENSE